MSRVTFLGALFAAVLSVSLVCAQEKKEGGKGGKGGDRPRPTPEQIFEKLDADHDGSLTFERGLRPMAEAVRILSAKHRVVLKIVGDVFGAEKAWLESFIAKHRLEQVVVRTGWLPYEAVGKAISTCHIGLIWFLPSPNHRIAAPNKCFNYLLYGLPVVAPGFPQSHFAVLEREGCARLMDPTSPEACAEALSKMIADRAGTEGMAARSRALSREKYRWEHMEPVLLDLYRRVLE